MDTTVCIIKGNYNVHVRKKDVVLNLLHPSLLKCSAKLFLTPTSFYQSFYIFKVNYSQAIFESAYYIRVLHI